MKTPTCIEFLKCFFSPEEKLDISERLARAMQQKIDTEEEFGVIKKQFNEQIAGFANEARKKTIIRQDVHGELVKIMDMTDADRQFSIPGFPEPIPPPVVSVDEPVSQPLPGMEDSKLSSAGAND